MTLTVTPIFVAVFALIQIIITVRVGFRRAVTDIHFYDEGDITLRRRQRAHANFTETVPITLVAMALAELMGLSAPFLWAGGGLLLAARALHYWIITAHGWGPARAISMLMTFTAMGGFAVSILWLTLT